MKMKTKRTIEHVLLLGSALVLSTCGHAPATPVPAAPPTTKPVVATTAPPAPSAALDLTYWKGRTDLITAPPPPQPAALPLPDIARWRLPNGLDVMVVPRKGLPLISFTLALKAGSYDEAKDRTQGVADFTAAMLRHGAGKRSAEQIASAIDSVGGALEAAAGAESTVVTCSVLSASTDTCLSLLGDVLLRPTFPAAEMPQIRDQMLAALGGRDDDPHQLAAEHFDNLLFGEGHPDGWVLMPSHVKAITRDSLMTFWKTYYRPNNGILTIAGDVDPAAIKARIARTFGGWTKGVIPARPAFQIPEAHGVRVMLVDKPELTQATLMFGHPGLRHGDPDWYAATLVNYVLGGSDFSSRLMI
ncbi:MAG TPA: pitrilysin family protein, partial [Polyangia bacterium]|nr:pitrilysin family protein [Polyangia bacterium]